MTLETENLSKEISPMDEQLSRYQVFRWFSESYIVSSLFLLIQNFLIWVGRKANRGLWGRGWIALCTEFAINPQRVLAALFFSGLGVNGVLLLMTETPVQSEGLLVRGILLALGLSAVYCDEGTLSRVWRNWEGRRLFRSKDSEHQDPTANSQVPYRSESSSLSLPIFFGSLVGFIWWYSPGTTFLGILSIVLAIGLKNKSSMDNRSYLIRLFWVSLGLRVALVTISCFWAILTSRYYPHPDVVDFQIQIPMLFGDGGYFTARAWATSQLWRAAEVWPHALFEVRQVYGSSSYLYVPTIFFYVFGGDALISVRLINAFIGACLPLVTFGLTKDLFGFRASRLASGIACVYPSLMIWSLDLLKDSLFIVIFVSVIWCLVRFQRKCRIGYFLVSLVGIAMMMSIRFNLGAIVLAIAIFSWVPLLWKLITRRSRVRQGIALLLLVGVILSLPIQRPVGQVLYDTFSVQRGATETPGRSMYTLWDRRLYVHLAPESWMKAVRFSEIIRAYALSQYHFWLEPVLWSKHSLALRLAFPQMVLWYGILLLGLVGFWRLWRDPCTLWTLLISTFLISFFIGMTSGNVGTVFRHRDLLTPIWLLLAAGGLVGGVMPNTRYDSSGKGKVLLSGATD